MAWGLCDEFKAKIYRWLVDHVTIHAYGRLADLKKEAYLGS